MSDQLSLYNEALRAMGERKISGLAEKRAPRYLLDDVWDNNGIKRLLEMGLWNFATRTRKASPTPSVEPDFGLAQAYDKPSDWIRTVQLSDDEYFTQPLLDYNDEGIYLFTDSDPIYWRYVSSDAAFGSDLSIWPESFSEMAAQYFAWKACPAETSSEKKIERLREDFRRARTNARSKDAMNQPTAFPPDGNWVRARAYGGHSRRDRGNRGSLIG